MCNCSGRFATTPVLCAISNCFGVFEIAHNVPHHRMSLKRSFTMKKCEKCGYISDNDEFIYCVNCGSKMATLTNDKNLSLEVKKKSGADKKDNSNKIVIGAAVFTLIASIAVIAVAVGRNMKHNVIDDVTLESISIVSDNADTINEDEQNISANENAVLDVASDKTETDTSITSQTEKDETVNEFIYTPNEEEGELFRKGLLAVCNKDGLWGYINENGEYAIKPQFKMAKRFSQSGLAPVCNDLNKWGYIDTEGNYVIRSQFDDAEPFGNDGTAVVAQYNSNYEEKYGYINMTGEYLIKPNFESAHNFSANGLACVCASDLYGYINHEGEYVIAPVFADAGDFADNGLAYVKKNEEFAKYGYINETGSYVIDEQYDGAGTFSRDGVAVVSIKDYDNAWLDVESFLSIYGCIDQFGNTILDFNYSYLSDFDEYGFARYYPKGSSSLWNIGLVDIKGNVLVYPDNSYGASEFGCGMAAIVNDDGYRYIDTNGSTVLNIEDVSSIGKFFKDGYAVISKMEMTDSGYFDIRNKIIDTTGNTIVSNLSGIDEYFCTDRVESP